MQFDSKFSLAVLQNLQHHGRSSTGFCPMLFNQHFVNPLDEEKAPGAPHGTPICLYYI